MQIAVVIPTFNEAANIEAVMRRVRDALPSARIVVVDDASPDGTADIVRGLIEVLGDVELIGRSAKSGLGSAYRVGFHHVLAAGADVCVEMDADLSHDPGALPALVSAVEHGAHLALGSRYVPGGRIDGWPRSRRSLSRWGNRYAALMLGLAVNDATSGYRAYSAEALRLIDVDGVRAEGYGFQVEMTHRLVRAGGSIVEIPIRFVDRAHGESKMSAGIVREALLMVPMLAVRDLVDGRRRRRRSRS